MSVRVEFSVSTPRTVNVGVPQGFHLGQLFSVSIQFNSIILLPIIMTEASERGLKRKLKKKDKKKEGKKERKRKERDLEINIKIKSS